MTNRDMATDIVMQTITPEGVWVAFEHELIRKIELALDFKDECAQLALVNVLLEKENK